MSHVDPLGTAPPVAAGNEHHYLSTACLHHQHDYCSGAQRQDGGTKIPATCKFCSAPCRCTCHTAAGDRG